MPFVSAMNDLKTRFSKLTSRVAGNWRRLCTSRRGGAIIIFGLVGPAVIGFAGLSIDAVSWYMTKRELQSIADGAALAATHTLNHTQSQTQTFAAAQADFTKGITPRLTTTSMVVENPPVSGLNAGDNTAVKVTLNFQHPLHFAGLFSQGNTNIFVLAVAKSVTEADQCVLALDPTRDRALQFTGASDVLLGCGISSNSNSDQSIYISGNATLTASPVAAVGDIHIGGSAILHADGPLKPLSPPVIDPYGPLGRNLQVPADPAGCTANNLMVHGTATLSPGRYCGGIRFTAANATLLPGTYIIDGGDFKTTGNSTISGENVTIVLTGSGSNYANIDITGGTTLTLSAPSAGSDFEGIVVFQDPDADYSQHAPNKLNGGSDLDITGAIYTPSRGIEFTGGANGLSHCIQIVARTVTFNGSARLENDCTADDGVAAIEQIKVRLVE